MSTTTNTMGLIKPDTTDEVTDTIAALAANFALIDALYPLGTIYQSTKNTNPGTFIGGTWTPITNVFLWAAGSIHAAGATGGHENIALTAAQIPTLDVETGAVPITSPTSSDGTWRVGSIQTTTPAGTIKIHNTGGGSEHSIMPPFKSVYMWERTA